MILSYRQDVLHADILTSIYFYANDEKYYKMSGDRFILICIFEEGGGSKQTDSAVCCPFRRFMVAGTRECASPNQCIGLERTVHWMFLFAASLTQCVSLQITAQQSVCALWTRLWDGNLSGPRRRGFDQSDSSATFWGGANVPIQSDSSAAFWGWEAESAEQGSNCWLQIRFGFDRTEGFAMLSNSSIRKVAIGWKRRE